MNGRQTSAVERSTSSSLGVAVGVGLTAAVALWMICRFVAPPASPRPRPEASAGPSSFAPASIPTAATFVATAASEVAPPTIDAEKISEMAWFGKMVAKASR